MGLATITNNILVDSGIVTANIPDSSFPSQTGNSGKYLTTNGSALSWATPTDTGITSLNSLTGTSQTFAVGTSGTDFGISSVGTTHTFNIPTASATNRGLLGTSDWSTFNNKQSAITLTTTGSSGSATFSSNTLNIPTYTLAGLGGITLTSLSSTATGLTYTNTTGIFSLTAGYVIPTTTSTGNWDTAYNNRITNLTTTGSSGAATLISNTLNIPIYQAVLTDPVTGTGTSNQIAYWTSSSTIGGLATTTYPSLTELSYVKGVTSSIQTQIDGKQGILTLTTTGTSGAATLVGSTLNIPQYSGGGSMAIGGSITSATAGSVLFAGASGVLAQDNSNLFWDDTNNLLGIGTSSPTNPLTVYSASATYRGINTIQATNDTLAAVFTGQKIRGTGAVQNGDYIFNFNAQGYDGSAYQSGSVIRWYVDGAVSTGVVPTAVEIRTGSSGTGTARLTISSTGVSTFSGQVISTQANSTTTGGGQIYLNGATGNRIDFNTNGVASPAFTTRSAGTKIVLFPAVSATTVDYALGIESNTMWFSVPDTTTASNIFKWYAGTTNVLTLTGAGAMTLSRNQNTATYIQISNTTSGTASQSYINLASDATAGNGTFGKYSTTTTAFKIIASKDIYLYNSTTAGDIAILNDFASGTIKFAAGGSSTAQLTLSSAGVLTQSVNQNASTNYIISNTTSGTASESRLTLTSDASSGSAIFGKYSTTTTANKIIAAGDAYIYNATSGDIAILNDFASGTIIMAAGGSSTAQMTIATTGATTFTSSVTANSLIKSGGTASQILAADGSVITAGTNITISSGTISASGSSFGGTGSVVATSQTTTSTTYTDLLTTGPSVTVTIGVSGTAIVMVTANAMTNTNGAECYMSFAATGVAADDARAFISATRNTGDTPQGSAVFWVSGLTAGSNTFTAKYKTTSGSTATFFNRNIIVIPV